MGEQVDGPVGITVSVAFIPVADLVGIWDRVLSSDLGATLGPAGNPFPLPGLSFPTRKQMC